MKNPVVFQSHSVIFDDSPQNGGGFSKTLNVEWTTADIFVVGWHWKSLSEKLAPLQSQSPLSW